MSKPIDRPREIYEGKRDKEMPGFSEISAWLGRVPKTWLPALLIRVVKACEHQKVFQEGGLEKVVASAKADAHNPLWMLRELDKDQANQHSPATPTQISERVSKCPQCGEATVQPRDSEDYCEECGWPDENREEEPDQISDGWVSVTERLPETSDGMSVETLVFNGNRVSSGYFEPATEDDKYRWETDEGLSLGRITHWRPLPPPPTEGKEI